MRDEEKLSDKLNELAEALAGLTPHESHLNRDRLMYEAGRAAALSAEPLANASRPANVSRWAWPAATAVSTIAATVLGVLLALPSTPQVVERVVYVEAVQDSLNTRQPSSINKSTPELADLEAMHPADERFTSAQRHMFWLPSYPLRSNNYLAQRAMILTWGVDALPQPDLTNMADYQSQPPLSAYELRRELLREFPSHRSNDRRVRDKSLSTPNNRTGRTTSDVFIPA